jgi:hypothetical protein
MRVFRLSFALWLDPHWRRSFRKSWKHRRYWLAKPEMTAISGHPLALQFGPLTFKFILEGKDHG